MEQQSKKRSRDQLDTDSDNGQMPTSFPRFLIIESTKPDQPLAKLSPFVIEKVLVSIAGSPKSVKKLNSGSLLVEIEKAKHAENLMKLTRFFEIPAKCYPHTSLNTSRGIIRCPDLAGVSEEEIVSNLADQNVTAARRITIFRDNVRRNTNTIVLTFNTSILPRVLKVGYLKVPVDMYIPNPLQCYACFKFGHHERKCKLYGGDELCRRCGITSYTHHDENKCTNEIKCVNCGEDHPSTSRTCKIWKREKEVVTIKYKEGLSFPEARKIVEARYNLSFSTVVKTNKNNSVQLKDAQTQTTNASTQTTEPQTKMSTNVNASQKVQAAKKPEKPVAKSPTKSQNKVLSDRLPKGSDDQIQQHNRFQCLEEDMEEATDHAEQITNKQGRIIKLNKR